MGRLTEALYLGNCDTKEWQKRSSSMRTDLSYNDYHEVVKFRKKIKSNRL